MMLRRLVITACSLQSLLRAPMAGRPDSQIVSRRRIMLQRCMLRRVTTCTSPGRQLVKFFKKMKFNPRRRGNCFPVRSSWTILFDSCCHDAACSRDLHAYYIRVYIIYMYCSDARRLNWCACAQIILVLSKIWWAVTSSDFTRELIIWVDNWITR